MRHKSAATSAAKGKELSAFPPYAGKIESEFLTLHSSVQNDQILPNDALIRLVALAVESIPGCEYAAITALSSSGRPRSLAVSDEMALRVDTLQYESGEGPCLSAAEDDGVFQVDDVSLDARWPLFGEAVTIKTPVRSALSCSLQSTEYRSALNLYSSVVRSFTADSLASAAEFVTHAQVLVMHAASKEKVANLSHALSTSREIGTAVGILMGARRITAEEAFDLLRASSQHLHRKVHQIAREVIFIGTLPEY